MSGDASLKSIQIPAPTTKGLVAQPDDGSFVCWSSLARDEKEPLPSIFLSVVATVDGSHQPF